MLTSAVPPTMPRYGLLLAVIAYAELVAGIETGMIYTALAVFMRIFRDPAGVGWLLTGYLLVGSAAAAICARLGDMYGRRRVLLVILSLCALGSLISACASNLTWIIIGRAVQGVAAAVMPLCFGLVREHIPAGRVPFAIGVIASAASIGAGAGILFGGMIVDHFPWHMLFVFSTGAIVLAIATVFWMLPPSRRQPQTRSLDVVGGLLFAPAIGAILFAITKASTWGWLDTHTLVLLLGGIAVLAYWVRYELGCQDPLIDVRLLGSRQILLANLGMAFAAFGAMQIQVVTMMLQQPTWTVIGLGVSATMAGTLKMPGNVGSAIAASLSGLHASRSGGRRAFLCGALICAAGWIGLSVNHALLWFVVTCILIIGFGTGYLYAAIPNVVLEVAPSDRTSEATGLSSVVRSTFQAAGSQMIAIALASSTVNDAAHGSTLPNGEAFMLAFVIISLSCIGCVACAYWLPIRRKSTQ